MRAQRINVVQVARSSAGGCLSKFGLCEYEMTIRVGEVLREI